MSLTVKNLNSKKIKMSSYRRAKIPSPPVPTAPEGYEFDAMEEGPQFWTYHYLLGNSYHFGKGWIISIDKKSGHIVENEGYDFY